MNGIRLLQVRYHTEQNCTLSVLHEQSVTGLEFLCYILENGKRYPKVMKETRVPSGTYRLKLRDYGGFHDRYEQKFPEMHRGMIELVDVGDFTDVLMHVGNTAKDTDGCLLVGSEVAHVARTMVSHSRMAYRKVYPRIADGIVSGASFLQIIDAA